MAFGCSRDDEQGPYMDSRSVHHVGPLEYSPFSAVERTVYSSTAKLGTFRSLCMNAA